MQENKISIIITTHNYASFLEECVDSVISQTISPREIIVIDDASDDSPDLIMKKYENNSKVKFYSVNFKNAQKSRNFGLEKATGKYILFLDADDYLREDCIEKMQKEMEKDPKLALIYSDRINFGDELFLDKINKKKEWVTDNYSFKELQNRNYISLPSLIKRKDFNGFDEKINRFQDWDAWLSYLKGRKAKRISEPLFFVRFHGNNKTFSPNKYLEKMKVKMKHGIISYANVKNGSKSNIIWQKNKKILFIIKWDDNFNKFVDYLNKVKNFGNEVFLMFSLDNDEISLPVDLVRKIESMKIPYRTSRVYNCDQLCNFLIELRLVSPYELDFLAILNSVDDFDLSLVDFKEDVLWSSDKNDFKDLSFFDEACWFFNRKGIEKFLNL